jgi:hypothetical protein
MNRWRSWTFKESELFRQQSLGFVVAVQNQLRRFEPFLAINIVDALGNDASEIELDSELLDAADGNNNAPGRNGNELDNTSTRILFPTT